MENKEEESFYKKHKKTIVKVVAFTGATIISYCIGNAIGRIGERNNTLMKKNEKFRSENEQLRYENAKLGKENKILSYNLGKKTKTRIIKIK